MLKSERLSLGPCRLEDMPLMFQWLNDAESGRLNGTWRPVNWHAHVRWFESLGQDASKLFFMIRRLADNKAIGWLEVNNIDPVNRAGEIGLRIADASARNQGFGREALQALTAYAWNDLNLERLHLVTFATNMAAQKAYTAAGFRREGRLRRAAFVNGVWQDVIIMSMLRPRAKSKA